MKVLLVIGFGVLCGVAGYGLCALSLDFEVQRASRSLRLVLDDEAQNAGA